MKHHAATVRGVAYVYIAPSNRTIVKMCSLVEAERAGENTEKAESEMIEKLRGGGRERKNSNFDGGIIEKSGGVAHLGPSCV